MATATLHKGTGSFTSFLSGEPPEDPHRKVDALFFTHVAMSNPNGDPDEGNRPRQDKETGHGIITDVCLKRHIRDVAALLNEGAEGYGLYIGHKDVLDHKLMEVHKDLGIAKKGDAKKKKGEKEAEGDESEEEKPKGSTKEDRENEAKAKIEMCKRYFDIRWFGAVMGSKMANCGQVRGPIQMGYSRSLDPVTITEDSIVRLSIQTDREAESNIMGQTFGNKWLVRFGLYMGHLNFTPAFAERTGFTKEDFRLFWESLARTFEYAKSSARSNVNMEQIITFEHDSPLGRAPAHKLFRMVTGVGADGKPFIRRRDDTKPPTTIEDYSLPSKDEVEERIKKAGIKGVTVKYLL